MAKRLARNQSWPERILWARLRRNPWGVRWQKQYLAFGYIIDFYCYKARLAIEVDGKQHLASRAYDYHRDAVLSKHGIETIRFPAKAVIANPAAVVILIGQKLKRSVPCPSTTTR